MGLSIFLGPHQAGYVPPDIEIITRLNIARQALEFYRNHFTPKTWEIWRGASASSLGGTMIRTEPFSPQLLDEFGDLNKYLSQFSLQEKSELILKVLGDWTIGGNKVDGFLNVNNKGTWRATYGDIELNIYSTEKFADLVHLMKSEPQLELQLIDSFLTQFPKEVVKQALKIAVIYFGIGTPSKYEINTVTGAYYGSEDSFIGDCLRTIVEEEGDPVKNSFTPYRQKFLISSLNGVPAFRQFLETLFAKYHVARETTGSVTLVGRDIDSFQLFYEELTSKILKPLARELPNKDLLLQKIRDAVEGKGLRQTRLTQDS